MEGLQPLGIELVRGVERLIAVLIGGASIYLGYRLFMALPEVRRDASGEGKVELPGGISIYVSRVGPGVFFALFGASIVALSIVNGLSIAPSSGTAQARPGVNYGAVAAARVAGTVSQDRANLLRDLRAVTRLEARLALEKGPFASVEERTDLMLALPRLKRHALASVWAEDWGEWQAFVDWTELRADAPPSRLPKEFADLFTVSGGGG